jgi:hypothetical protein
MLIRRISIFSGAIREREIAVTQEQLEQWAGGMLIQNAIPNLTKEEREFIMNGVTQEEWDEICKDEE